MALVFTPLSPSPRTTMGFTSTFPFRLVGSSVRLSLKFSCGFQIRVPFARNRGATIAMASKDVDEPVPEGGEDISDDEEEEIIPIQDLPLESKLQLKLEQKMKMKITKKVRLRRKKLLRKRRMRKRGRWPPSKMKKLKNV